MTYWLHEFNDGPPLSAEDIIDEVHQLFMLAPSLWFTETEHFVGGTARSHAFRSQIGQLPLHTVEYDDAQTLEIGDRGLRNLLATIAVTCCSFVR